MSITLKTPSDIEKMRIAGKLAADVLDMITPFVVPGVTTDELDQRCHDFMVNVQKTVPAPLDYHGFPKSICTSVNHQVCHGIPSTKKLKKGDIINIDITVIKDDFHGDTSKMYILGEAGVLANRLVSCTQKALYIGINMVKPGAHLGDIGHAIEHYIKKQRFSIVQEYCGHGIGRVFHEDPQVLHYGNAGTGPILEEGMTFTIEPMINAGKRDIKILADDWTVVTKDKSLSAQFEHTLTVTSTGFEIFTLRDEEPIEVDHIPSSVLN